MTNVTHQPPDPTDGSVKYILLRLSHTNKKAPFCHPGLAYAVVSGQSNHDQSGEQWLFVKPHWSALTKPRAARPTCPLEDLLTQAFGVACTPSPDITDKRRNLLARVKQFIDESLALESLDTALIGRRFGMSRSSVYRLFGSEGGLANYIRRCRLMLDRKSVV